TVPQSVTITSGANSIGFTANAPSAVCTNSSAVLTASLNSTSKNFTLTLNKATGTPTLSSLTCSPSSVTPPATASCTVSLTAVVKIGSASCRESSKASLSVLPSATT